MFAVFCKKKIVCEPYTHTWGMPGPLGGVFFAFRLFALELSTLRETYKLYGYTVLYKLLCETLHETYTKLTRSLQLHLVTKLTRNLHEPYAKLTEPA